MGEPAQKLAVPTVAPPKENILKRLDLFVLKGPGLGGWLSKSSNSLIFERLARLESDPLSLAQFAQLLVLGHQAPPSDDFLRYYWLSSPVDHPYSIPSLSDFQPDFSSDTIKSLDHLAWGLKRVFADALLWWGDIRTGYLALRDSSKAELDGILGQRRWNHERMKRRGPSLPLHVIPKDNRYLISEPTFRNSCIAFSPIRGSSSSRRPNWISQAQRDIYKLGHPPPDERYFAERDVLESLSSPTRLPLAAFAFANGCRTYPRTAWH
jgi:hypothetical protein